MQIQESHPHPKYPRLQIQLRRKSRFYQGLTFLDGRKVQKSLKTDQLATAFKLGEDWYKKLLRASVSEGRRHPLDKLTTVPTVAEVFANYRLTLPPHRREYVDTKWGALTAFWRTTTIQDVTPQSIREFYRWRRRHKTQMGTVVTNNTLHKDVTLLRQILTHAIEEEHLTALPIIPPPGKVAANPRPWFTREEWDHLTTVALDRFDAVSRNRKLIRQREDLLDFIVMMVESCLRVGELRALTVGQVRVVPKTAKTQAHLLIDVKGKVGHRVAVAGGLAVVTFQRRAKGLKPHQRLFTTSQRDGFRELLIAANLRTDAFGNKRNLKSLRATAISFKVLAGAPSPNLLMIARNAGTSVTMIDSFYAKRLSAEMGAAELSRSTA
jgi:integrase